MFFTSGLVFDDIQGRRVPFSCFALHDSFSTVPRASNVVFMFCALGLEFSGAECVWSHFHVLISRTRFRRYGGCSVPFSFFARPNSFSAVPRASGLVFMFCALGHVFGSTDSSAPVFMFCVSGLISRGNEGDGSNPDFMFCAPSIVFGGTEGVGSRFHVLRTRTRFRRYPRASGTVFIFCAPVLIFGGTEGVGSRFHFLRARTPFSAVPRASGPVFIFCAPGLISGCTEGVGSRYHVLRVRTRF
jgi:hypothetical protein